MLNNDNGTVAILVWITSYTDAQVSGEMVDISLAVIRSFFAHFDFPYTLYINI